MLYTINQQGNSTFRSKLMLGKNKIQPNGDGADGDHSSSGSGHNEPLPPLYWSVFHHQNLHADTQRQEFTAQESPKERNNNTYAPANSETSPLVRMSTSSCSSHKRWGRVKDAVKTNELFIRYTSGLDEGKNDEHKTQRWSDLTSESYELTLRECLFLFIALLAMGVLAYSFIFEHWGIIDSLYFTVVMLSTTGYGDMSPTTPGGKLFASVFALAGIVLLGLVLGVVGSQLVEVEMAYSQKIKSEASKVLEKTFTTKSYKSDEFEGENNAALDMHVTGKSLYPQNGSSLSTDTVQSQDLDGVRHLESRREEQVFMSRVMKQLPGMIPLLMGGIIMAALEHWKWYDLIYYCVATATTIGFGDLVPHREVSKLVAVFFIPIGVAMMGQILGSVASYIVDSRRAEYNKRLWSCEMKLEDIEALDEGNDGGVSELEYIKFMLVAMKKIDKELFEDLHHQFVQLDPTGDGQITKSDLIIMAERKMKTMRHKMELSEYKVRSFRLGH